MVVIKVKQVESQVLKSIDQVRFVATRAIQYACFRHFELCQPPPFETTLYLVHSLLVFRGPLKQVMRDRDQVLEGRSEIKYCLRIPSVRACILSIIVFALYESNNQKEKLKIYRVVETHPRILEGFVIELRSPRKKM